MPGSFFLSLSFYEFVGQLFMCSIALLLLCFVVCAPFLCHFSSFLATIQGNDSVLDLLYLQPTLFLSGFLFVFVF